MSVQPSWIFAQLHTSNSVNPAKPPRARSPGPAYPCLSTAEKWEIINHFCFTLLWSNLLYRNKYLTFFTIKWISWYKATLFRIPCQSVRLPAGLRVWGHCSEDKHRQEFQYTSVWRHGTVPVVGVTVPYCLLYACVRGSLSVLEVARSLWTQGLQQVVVTEPNSTLNLTFTKVICQAWFSQV